MIGTVQELGTTKNGKAKLKIDGTWFFAGRCNVSSVQVGHKLDFTWSPFGDKGQFKGMDAWGFANETNAKGGQTRDVPIPKPDPNYLDEPSLRFISNVVGSAITAQTLKDPTEVTKWALAAKSALGALQRKGAEFDDDDRKIPF